MTSPAGLADPVSRLRDTARAPLCAPRSIVRSVHPRRRKSATLWHSRRPAYLLLETVLATGLLVIGLGVIGTQLNQSEAAVKNMERRLRALTLMEGKLAELDLGLVKLESFNEIEEQDFGPRHPDWGWRLTTEEAALDGLFSLKLQVLYRDREEEYQPDSFEFDDAEIVQTVYALRPGPQPLDLSVDLGLSDERLEEVGAQLSELGIDGFDDPLALDPKILASLDIEQFLDALPVLAEILGVDLSSLGGVLPAQVGELLDSSGVLEGQGNAGDESASDSAGSGQ